MRGRRIPGRRDSLNAVRTRKDGMMRRAVLFSLLLILPLGGLQSAPAPRAPSDAAKAMVGKWEFSNADRDKICNLVFRTDPGTVGMKLEFEQGCYALFPFIKE